MGSGGDSMVAKIAFLFPGQGSQVIGMGKLAYESSSSAKQLFEQADQILGFSLSKIMFEGPEEKLRETNITQPALFVASAAALELLKERKIQASWAAGHSLGEYSALYAAGVINFENALKLVQARGAAMAEAGQKNPGTMAAVIGLDYEKLNDICKAVTETGSLCVTANFNSESQIVISGSKDGVSKAMEMATAAGAAKVVQLNVSGAFHSPLMITAVEKMKPLIESIQFSNARYPVITNVDAQLTTDGFQFQEKLIQQIDHSVLWNDTLKILISQGAELFVEVGSGKVLSMMVKKIDRKKPVFCTDEIDQLDKHLAVASAQ